VLHDTGYREHAELLVPGEVAVVAHLHPEQVLVYNVDGVTDSTPDVKLHSGEGRARQVLPLAKHYNGVVVPIPLSIWCGVCMLSECVE